MRQGRGGAGCAAVRSGRIQCLFSGPPGAAKSMLARRVRVLFASGTASPVYFEYLLNEFSTPDEMLGPVSLKSLENDEYRRITDGYLPQAHIAFLNEIWKAGSAILNTLLTLVNEKKFYNGNKSETVPLEILLAAANELPEKMKTDPIMEQTLP